MADFRLLPVAICVALVASGQANPAPDWQTAAGGKMAFDVASVKLSKGEFSPPNFPLDAGDSFVNFRSSEQPRGRFKADFPLAVYILFAYKLPPDSMQAIQAHLAKSVANDRFSIEARAEGNPTKDQMRLMMQSLLAERFNLAVHFETHEVPVLAMTLIKPSKTGPNLRPHSDGPSCEDATAVPAPFPPRCDVFAMLRTQTGSRLSSRNTTMALIADSIPSLARLGRPVVDKTGLSGRFDFTLEWTPDPPASPDSPSVPPDSPGLTFLDALREQLGLKLESSRGPIRTLVIDHAEPPSEN